MLQNIGFYLSAVEKEETVDRIIQDFLALIFVDHISDRIDDEVVEVGEPEEEAVVECRSYYS